MKWGPKKMTLNQQLLMLDCASEKPGLTACSSVAVPLSSLRIWWRDAVAPVPAIVAQSRGCGDQFPASAGACGFRNPGKARMGRACLKGGADLIARIIAADRHGMLPACGLRQRNGDHRLVPEGKGTGA
jgi:hypothetical protein